MYIGSLFFVFTVLLLQNNTAQDGKSNYTLLQCIKYAKENNNDIKKSAIEEEQSYKKINEVIGSGLPQITLSGNIVDNIELPTQVLPGESFGGAAGSLMEAKFGTQYNYTFSAEATQMIFNGSFWIGLDAAKYSNLYYKQKKEYVSEDIEYNIAAAYYQTLVLQKQITLLEQNSKLIDKSLADTKLFYQNGKAKEVDVNRLNVSKNNIIYQLKKANEYLTQSYNNLKFQMGMNINQVISLSDSVKFTDDKLLEKDITGFNYENDETVNFENRNDYKILQTTLELQKLNKKNIFAQYLPSISAYGSFSYQGLRTKFDLFDSNEKWFNFYSVGLQMRFPIFTGGQTYAKMQQADLQVDIVKEDIKKAENGINMQVSNAVTKFNNAFENTKTNKLNMDLAQKVYDITLIEYKEGVTEAFSLVDSETKLREAQTNYINSLLELYIAKFDMEKAKGTMSVYLTNIENTK